MASNATIKLSRMQQIHTIEEAMTDEEWSEYLDACDMSQDF
jgi:hypothetical protein